MSILAVGTDKGAWLLDGDAGWTIGDTQFPGWRVTSFGQAADGTYLAGVASGWFGPAVHRSTDLTDWEQVTDGPSYAPDGPKLEQVWTFTTAPSGRIWCGVAEAGLFTSDDDGATWHGVEGFNTHPTRPQWGPGAGGMCAHRVLIDGDHIWAAASAIGVFASNDGGESFELRNDGIALVAPGELPDTRPETGYCVHCIVADPADPSTIWRQDHSGVYRTADGARTWERIEQGLPAGFGFPIGRDHASGALFVMPLEADQNRTPVGGEFAAWRSTDGGDSWHKSGAGWPDVANYDAVLRGAMATDGDGGVIVGTTGGQLWATEDAGDSWRRLPGTFPRINCVELLPHP